MKMTSRNATTALLSGVVVAATLSTAHSQAVRVNAPANPSTLPTFYALDDRIDAARESGVPGKAQLSLRTEHPWYRAIKLVDSRGVAMEVQKADGQYRTSEALEIDTNRLGPTITVEFWKAKFLGVPTRVYNKTFNKSDLVGQRVTFRWWEGGGESAATQPAPPSGVLTTPDKDQIRVSNANGQAGRVQIRFRTAGPITWWKSVRVIDNRGQAIEIKRQDGKQLSDDINLPRDRFDSTLRIEFWKAKFLGTPTRVDTRVYNADSFAGRIVTFTWEKD